MRFPGGTLRLPAGTMRLPAGSPNSKPGTAQSKPGTAQSTRSNGGINIVSARYILDFGYVVKGSAKVCGRRGWSKLTSAQR